jgi:hypothetical protein
MNESVAVWPGRDGRPDLLLGQPRKEDEFGADDLFLRNSFIAVEF